MVDPRRRHRRYAYGPYHGGPDPLAPPFDLRTAIDRIGRDVMEGSSPRQAVQEMLRRGLDSPAGRTRGLDDLMRQLWQRRRGLQRDHRIDGTLQEGDRVLVTAFGAGLTWGSTVLRWPALRCAPLP